MPAEVEAIEAGRGGGEQGDCVLALDYNDGVNSGKLVNALELKFQNDFAGLDDNRCD
jgi:hypothetical protein